MKILEDSVKLNNDDTIRVEVLGDDDVTITPIDNYDVIGKNNIQIKKELKDIINAKKAKRDNLIALKGQLEGQIL